MRKELLIHCANSLPSARLLVLACCWLGFGAFAGAGTLRGPASGLAFDPASQSIRPILGVPGAAYLGPAVLKGVQFVALAPDGDAAVVLLGKQLSLVRGLSGGSPASFPLAELAAAPARFSWSPDSSVFAWYSRGAASITIARNRSTAPLLLPPLDVSALGGVLSSIAVDPSGQFAVAAAGGDSSGGIYLVPTGAPPRLVAAMRSPSALAFDPSGQNLYAVEGRNGAVLRIESIATTAISNWVVNAARDRMDVTSVAIGGSNLNLYTMSDSKRRLCVYSLANGNLLGEIPLPSAPSGFERNASASFFVLNSSRDAAVPLLVLDESSKPAVYVVPGERLGP